MGCSLHACGRIFPPNLKFLPHSILELMDPNVTDRQTDGRTAAFHSTPPTKNHIIRHPKKSPFIVHVLCYYGIHVNLREYQSCMMIDRTLKSTNVAGFGSVQSVWLNKACNNLGAATFYEKYSFWTFSCITYLRYFRRAKTHKTLPLPVRNVVPNFLRVESLFKMLKNASFCS